MKYCYIITFFLFISNGTLISQESVEIKKREFKTVKSGFKVAWKHIKEGDDFYSDGGNWYRNALNEYLKSSEYNSGNDALNYKIGVSYLFSDDKEKAYDYLIKAYGINNNISGDILFLSGMALQYAGRFNEAIEKYQAFLSGSIRKSDDLIARANKRLEECKYALEVTKDTLKVDIQNVGKNINSEADEYSEVISPDGTKLYFATRKAIGPNPKNYYTDTKLDENIFMSQDINGKWNAAIPAGKNLMTSFCETPLYIDKSGEVMYIYVGYEGNGDIKYSEQKKGEWKKLKGEPFGLNTNHPETSFCISPSGDEIAFVSDRGTTGFGGKDIFFIKRNGNKWTKSVNGGETLNTRFNEESVRYSRSGDTLWFSSTGHNTIGGFDIFYSVRNGENGWGPAVNAGYPVNTPWNDLFYLPSPVSRGVFYFVSDRSGGFGGLDIYTGFLNLTEKPVWSPDSSEVRNADSLQVKDSSGVENKGQEPVKQTVIINEIDNISVSGISSGNNSIGVSSPAVAGNSSKGSKAKNKKK